MPSPLKTHDRVSSPEPRGGSAALSWSASAIARPRHTPTAPTLRSRGPSKLRGWLCALARAACAETELAAGLALLLGVALLAAVEVAVLVVVVVVRLELQPDQLLQPELSGHLGCTSGASRLGLL